MGSSETFLIGPETMDRTDFWTGKSPFVEDNRNGDFMDRDRMDYTLFLRDPEVGETEPVIGEWSDTNFGFRDLITADSSGVFANETELFAGSAEGDASVMRSLITNSEWQTANSAAPITLLEGN